MVAPSSTSMAEAQALFEALNLFLSLRYEEVVVETRNIRVVNCFRKVNLIANCIARTHRENSIY